MTLGGVASYWNENVFGAETLTGVVVHVPDDGGRDRVGAAVGGRVHEAIPDAEVGARHRIWTGWLYQPFASGALGWSIQVTVGRRRVALDRADKREHC